MSGPLGALGRAIAGLFLTPGEVARDDPQPVAPATIVDPRARVAIGVVCAAPDASTAGALLGAALAAARRAPCVLVLTWTGDRPHVADAHLPARAAARRLVASLGLRGLSGAVGAGRVVVARLPPDEHEAALAARRAMAHADATLLVAGAPRTAPFDALLAELDGVVVAVPADADPLVAELAIEASPGAVAWRVPSGAVLRMLARAGLPTPAQRAASRRAVERLG